jgi:hypothetical protein
MTATAPPPSPVFDKALPTLARAAKLPEAQAAAAYVGEWLAVLAGNPERAGEFDAELDDYAADLRRRDVLVGQQGAGFLLALWARLNPHDPLTATLVAQVDRRKALTGWRWCRWRGWVPAGEFDAWRYDRARERG